jgi:hypothetical protein
MSNDKCTEKCGLPLENSNLSENNAGLEEGVNLLLVRFYKEIL